MSQASAAHSFSSLQHSDNTSQASLSSGVTSADLTFLLHDPQETQRPDSAALTQNLANSSTFCEQGSIDFPEKAKVAEQLASSSKTSSLIAESLMDSRHLMPPSMIPARRSCKTSQGPGMDVETRQTEDDDQWNSYLHSLSRTYLGGCSDNVIVARQKAVGSREVVSSAENVENAVPQHQDADRTSDKPTTLTPTEGASSTQAPCLNVKKSGPDYTSRKKWLGSLLRQRVVFRTSNKRTLIKAGHVRKNTVAVNHVDHDIYDALAEHHVVDIVHALQVEDASLDRYRLTSFESPRQAPKPPGK